MMEITRGYYDDEDGRRQTWWDVVKKLTYLILVVPIGV